MSKVVINEITLTNIGDAIREKTGKTDLIAPGDMPNEIKGIVSGGGSEDCNGLHIPEEALVISGNCQYRFANGGWDWLINNYGDKITTKDLDSTCHMFSGSRIIEFPTAMNYMKTTTSYHLFNNTFSQAQNLRKIPIINNVRPNALNNLVHSCYNLEEFPENFAENWDWSYLQSQTTEYTCNLSQMFVYCYKLRSIPEALLKREHIVKPVNYTYALYYSGFNECRSLEELKLPVFNKQKWSSNAFYNMVINCSRLKKLTFEVQEDGTPYSAEWKSQIIDLTLKVGNCISSAAVFKNHTGFTDDTKITTPEQWHGYINGTYPDGWSEDLEYTTFGKTAATELINSLPDTSAYGTNTIKFKANSASAIPGENISDLPEEVIAVAAAKGWTVAFA